MMHSTTRSHVARAIKFLLLTLVIVVADFLPLQTAYAHGERNQEPFLRMRTVHWYDIEYSRPENAVLQINDELTITGKFRLFSKWPRQLPEPEKVYMNAASAGAVLTKVGAWVNSKSAVQSFGGELGRDYEFKVVLKARWSGTWHVHPMLNVKDAGGLLGPGQFYTVEGSYTDYVHSMETLSGETIENIQTYGLERVYGWHIAWALLAVFWLLWWIRRPVLLPRYLMAKDGSYEDQLVTPMDRKVSAVLLIIVLALAIGSYFQAEKQFPRTITLQAGLADIPPLKELPTVEVEMLKGRYHIPGRTVIADINVTNTTDKPIRLGEFTSASLRFLDRTVVGVDDGAAANSPQAVVAKTGLVNTDNSPIYPGEIRTMTIEATDAAWELERLSSLLNDPESTLGAMLFFYDEQGQRYITELFGEMIPVFK